MTTKKLVRRSALECECGHIKTAHRNRNGKLKCIRQECDCQDFLGRKK